MYRTKVLVAGATGMLGAMTARVLMRESDIDLTVSARSAGAVPADIKAKAKVLFLDACSAGVPEIAELIAGNAWVLNCIGVIKPYIHDDVSVEVVNAARVNGLFPHALACAAAQSGAKVVQVATDCVFSGLKGAYTERDAHDALDVYGKSKSIGEVRAKDFCHMRCSIIGPEDKSHLSLLDWFRTRKKGAELNGFTNHKWNGVTTYQFARLCLGIVRAGVLPKAPVQHVLPGDCVSKHELLNIFAAHYGRGDLKITPVAAKTVVDRTLSSVCPEVSKMLWAAAGYTVAPSIAEMVKELAAFQSSVVMI